MANTYIDDYIEDDYYEGEMAITPLPDPPSRGQTPEIFAEKGDAFLGALPRLALEIDAVATAMTANATNATSETSHTIAASGAKTFQTQIGKSYLVGMTVRASNRADGTVWMQGDVTGYDAATGLLTVTMNASQGSGTYTTWNLSLSTSSSSSGSLMQDYSAKSFIHGIGEAIPSATTLNLAAATGNLVHVTGSNPISGATMTAGKDIIVVFDGTPVLTHNATTHRLNAGGANISVQAGGRALYHSDGTTVWVTYFRPDGKALVETSPPAGAPVGSFLLFAGTTAPAGYLACPVAPTNISRSTYSALFAAIGTTWGNGDWSTTFGMPFFYPSWTMLQANGNVGSAYAGDVKSHTHTYTDVNNTGSVSTGGSFINSVGDVVTKNTGATGTSANLPAGAHVLICVKYQ